MQRPATMQALDEERLVVDRAWGRAALRQACQRDPMMRWSADAAAVVLRANLTLFGAALPLVLRPDRSLLLPAARFVVRTDHGEGRLPRGLGPCSFYRGHVHDRARSSVAYGAIVDDGGLDLVIHVGNTTYYVQPLAGGGPADTGAPNAIAYRAARVGRPLAAPSVPFQPTGRQQAVHARVRAARAVDSRGICSVALVADPSFVASFTSESAAMVEMVMQLAQTNWMLRAAVDERLAVGLVEIRVNHTVQESQTARGDVGADCIDALLLSLAATGRSRDCVTHLLTARDFHGATGAIAQARRASHALADGAPMRLASRRSTIVTSVVQHGRYVSRAGSAATAAHLMLHHVAHRSDGPQPSSAYPDGDGQPARVVDVVVRHTDVVPPYCTVRRMMRLGNSSATQDAVGAPNNRSHADTCGRCARLRVQPAGAASGSRTDAVWAERIGATMPGTREVPSDGALLRGRQPQPAAPTTDQPGPCAERRGGDACATSHGDLFALADYVCTGCAVCCDLGVHGCAPTDDVAFLRAVGYSVDGGAGRCRPAGVRRNGTADLCDVQGRCVSHGPMMLPGLPVVVAEDNSFGAWASNNWYLLMIAILALVLFIFSLILFCRWYLLWRRRRQRAAPRFRHLPLVHHSPQIGHMHRGSPPSGRSSSSITVDQLKLEQEAGVIHRGFPSADQAFIRQLLVETHGNAQQAIKRLIKLGHVPSGPATANAASRDESVPEAMAASSDAVLRSPVPAPVPVSAATSMPTS